MYPEHDAHAPMFMHMIMIMIMIMLVFWGGSPSLGADGGNFQEAQGANLKKKLECELKCLWIFNSASACVHDCFFTWTAS